ncbi:DNA primase [Maliponia aquimaris]|uniref:DNA primase n=1 Tax=Maliponia aquimaris TaxID=1673631 RepID=A0A238KZF6_9RHOB|nr:DNA primase [Maliponia aquimaris]SMX47592.1 DNA primase [Maliponia aquimaris]
MSLPPGFLDELRNRLSLSQVVGRKVLWDNRKSNQGKGDLWAPCPFHHEKTASFHVDDRKGYYYCFGCHAKGDAISFVRETENVSFIEAIEILAAEAGMEVPKQDPRAQEKADRRTQLTEVMEQAVGFFRLMLKTGAAAEARAYLARRGLNEAALARWEIGFAPSGWDNLRNALAAKGVPVDLMLAAGLVKTSEKGRQPYDVFRDRIMFPIRDGRGRAIAFGGRAMDPADNAKYLNSPETELFDKSRNLYNLKPAREASGKGQPLVVAEGYMDVIALSEAGFGASVAPLGTAVTEPQLQLMWRLSPEPVIALDGDTAGLRAAFRVIDLALPLLESGKGLRFALMPEGKDPDDLLRAEGPEAVKKVLDAAIPMVDLLWRQETEGKVFDSPERRAALEASLDLRIGKIQDQNLRYHYGQALKKMRFEAFRSPRSERMPGVQRAPWRPKGAPLPASQGAKASLLVTAGDAGERRLREEVILSAILSAPEIVEEFEGELEAMDCSDGQLAALRDALVTGSGTPEERRARVEAAIGAEALENLLARGHVAVVPCIRTPGNADLARLTVAEELAKLAAYEGWHAELKEAEEYLEASADEALTWRLAEAARVRAQAGRRRDEDDTDYEIGPNGAQIDREERTAFDSLLSQIRFDKGRK